MNPLEQALRGGVEFVVSKAVQVAARASRGAVSEWAPSIGSYGQPRRTPGSGTFTISPQRMREIVLKTPTAGAAMNAVLDYSTGVRVGVRNVDPSQPPPARAAKLMKSLLRTPNLQDDEREFRKMLLRDLFVLGYAAVEIEPGLDGSPAANLYVLDGGNLRVDYDQHGTITGYTQFDFMGKPIIGRDGVHTFVPEEVIFYQLDPVSESRWPMSRIQQLFACAIIEELMLSYIGGRFTDTNVPFGVMDLGDITEDEVKAAIGYWNEQVEEAQHPEHRIIFTGSKGGAKWLPFGYTLGELEAPQLLAAVRAYILALVGVTANEMGEGDSVNKANGFNLSYTFKKRAIEPMLDTFVSKTTQHLLIRVLEIDNLELYYEEIDSRDELLESQIEKIYLDCGIFSINYVRNKKGQPSIPGGEEPTINTGASFIPVSMIPHFAQAQLDALQILNIQSQVGIMQVLQAMQQPTVNADGTTSPAPPLPPLGTLPLMRMAQPPERFTTPDAKGSSSFKFGMPKPGIKPVEQQAKQIAKPSSSSAPTAPRGPVETAQRAGMRKDNQHG